MYTDEDLNTAIKKGIFSQQSVINFRNQFNSDLSPQADEEHFRLITGFNDIFVVIACSLLLYSSYSIITFFNETSAIFSIPILALFLSECFVRKRKMALPAIMLMLTFVAGVYFLVQHLLVSFQGKTYLASTACAAIAAIFHYQRFKVPVTVAAGAACFTGFLVALLVYFFPESIHWIQIVVLIGGIATFVMAMFWDSSDLARATHRTDVAFWLHLLSAPMIVHPVFSYLGILEGSHQANSVAIVILLYILMTLLSIIIDRRAFMVSSLLYVMYALSNLFALYGLIGTNLAITGVCLGGGLLLLSAYWQQTRRHVLMLIPVSVAKYLPPAH